MSRGLGYWQRFILEGLDHYGGRLLVTEYAKQQLGHSLSPGQQRAITRAASLLEDRGLCHCRYEPAAARNRSSLPRRLHVVRTDWHTSVQTAALAVGEHEEGIDELLGQWYAAPIRARRSVPETGDTRESTFDPEG